MRANQFAGGPHFDKTSDIALPVGRALVGEIVIGGGARDVGHVAHESGDLRDGIEQTGALIESLPIGFCFLAGRDAG